MHLQLLAFVQKLVDTLVKWGSKIVCMHLSVLYDLGIYCLSRPIFWSYSEFRALEIRLTTQAELNY